jgi:hypothetical protein
MKTYDITKSVELEEVPCCPICGNEINEMTEPAYGVYFSKDGWQSFCLIHDECGERLEDD